MKLLNSWKLVTVRVKYYCSLYMYNCELRESSKCLDHTIKYAYDIFCIVLSHCQHVHIDEDQLFDELQWCMNQWALKANKACEIINQLCMHRGQLTRLLSESQEPFMSALEQQDKLLKVRELQQQSQQKYSQFATQIQETKQLFDSYQQQSTEYGVNQQQLQSVQEQVSTVKVTNQKLANSYASKVTQYLWASLCIDGITYPASVYVYMSMYCTTVATAANASRPTIEYAK